jgi:N-acetylmuramoyl-L-alanine amidase
MIDQAGKTYQVNDLEAVSYHVSGANTRSVGICLVGNYEEYPPTDLQYRRVIGLIRYLEAKTGRPLDVIGHKEASGASTRCPGVNVDLESIRSKTYKHGI